MIWVLEKIKMLGALPEVATWILAAGAGAIAAFSVNKWIKPDLKSRD